MVNDAHSYRTILASIGVVLLVSTFLVYLGWRLDPSIAAENGILENVQAALLLLAAASYFYPARMVEQAQGLDRSLRAPLAFVCIACALREIDIDKLGDPRLYVPLELALRTFVVAGFVLCLILNAREIRTALARGRSLCALPAVLFTLAGVLLYLSSSLFDKGLIPVAPTISLLAEEVLELWACLLFLAASLMDYRTSARAVPSDSRLSHAEARGQGSNAAVEPASELLRVASTNGASNSLDSREVTARSRFVA